MKLITILNLMLICSASVAQTITYSNFSSALSSTLNIKVGDQASYNTALNTTTGNGVTWDASALIPQTGMPEIHFIYGSPGSTPNGSLYPAANYVFYDPALTSFVAYNYVNFSADSIVENGSYSPSTSHEIFQNPDKHLIFPFDYNQSFVDSYAKTNYSDATTISSFQTGTRTVTYSGYGTLILPQGSFTNVALISELRTNSLGPDSYTYTWYEVSSGKKLLLYESNDGDVLVAYNSDPAAGIGEI